MIIYNQVFCNYDEFKNIFGITEHGNGVKSRRNKILLGFLKDRSFRKWWLSFEEASAEHWFGNIVSLHNPYSIRTMDGLKTFAKWMLAEGKCYAHYVGRCEGVINEINLCKWVLRSTKYKLDHWHGICQDGDPKSVRYVNLERDERVFKMKAGKFMQAIIDESKATRAMPEQLKRWLGEEFSREWQSYAAQNVNTGLTLHVDDNFRDIYSRNLCKGNFHSCMTGKSLWTYYRDSIHAKAAYLTDKEGLIVARCIVYQRVYDDEGNVYRLAERQYTTDESEALKQMLVDLLIAGGHIDGYKRIGAGCHDNTAFVANDGTSMSDIGLYIESSLDFGENVSYQDSFVYYDKEAGYAYNTPNGGCDYELDTLDGEIEDPNRQWSAYHEEYLSEDDAVYDDYFEDWMPSDSRADAIYDGFRINIDDDHARSSDLFYWSEQEAAWIYYDECLWVDLHDDYFLYEKTVDDIEGNTQLRDDCTYSNYHEEWILDDDAKYSDAVGDYLWVGAAVYSEHEDDWLLRREAIHSDITDDYYSSEESLLEGEAEFRRKHALVVVA